MWIKTHNKLVGYCVLWFAGFVTPLGSDALLLTLSNSSVEKFSSMQSSRARSASLIGSVASHVRSSAPLNGSRYLFQTHFDSSDWSGQLIAYSIDANINPVPHWNAAEVLDAQDFYTGRDIFTYNPDADVIPGGSKEGQGIAFRWPSDYTAPNVLTEFSSGQINSLLKNAPYPAVTSDSIQIAANQAYGAALSNYLRGERSNEGVGYGFRDRNTVLGDIIHSEPSRVGQPDYRYPEAIAPKSYAAFKSNFSARAPMVYVGANDGMLHGFAESSGSEVIAYVPNAVFENLSELANSPYSHHYFVDVGPTIVDAYLATKQDLSSAVDGAWRTVLVSGVGGGGQAVFALDVTNPEAFDEANVADLVLWEFDDADDVDLGYTYGKPQIAKMANGRWAAIFGNGYNNAEIDENTSSTGYAVLFVVDLETGALIRKLSTKVGTVSRPNGLATPTLVDVNDDYIVDFIYAGDLLGNMWKFDVAPMNPQLWDSEYKLAANPMPVFTTEANQPITTQAQVALHPDGRDGFMLYFGTGLGSAFDVNDSLSQATQAFYGIWDKNESSLTVFDSSDLVVQTINNQYERDLDTADVGSGDTSSVLREMSNNELDFDFAMGWMIDLIPQAVEGAPNENNFEEKQLGNAVVRDGRVIFTTLIPSQNPLDFGGSSFVMQVNYRNGGALDMPVFDWHGNETFEDIDSNTSGRLLDAGIVPSPSILSTLDRDQVFASDSLGAIEVIRLNAGVSASGRQSWRQLD